MREILDHFGADSLRRVAAQTLLLSEGERSRRLYCLAEGAVEVFHDEVEIATIDEPGALFGEMSILLDTPHTASVRTLVPSRIHVIEDGRAFFVRNPGLLLPIATLLARRLQNATTYLVNIKEQFKDKAGHLGMVDEVLESIGQAQGDSFVAAAQLPPDP